MTELLTMRHQETMWLEWAIRKWVLSNPLNHQMAMCSSILLLNGNCEWNQIWENWESKSEVNEELAQTHRVLAPTISLPLHQPLHMASRTVLYNHWTEQENVGLWLYRWVCMVGWHLAEVGPGGWQLHSGMAPKDRGKGKSCQVVHLIVEGEMA